MDEEIIENLARSEAAQFIDCELNPALAEAQAGGIWLCHAVIRAAFEFASFTAARTGEASIPSDLLQVATAAASDGWRRASGRAWPLDQEN